MSAQDLAQEIKEEAAENEMIKEVTPPEQPDI